MGSTYFAAKFDISAILFRAISDFFWSFFIFGLLAGKVRCKKWVQVK